MSEELLPLGKKAEQFKERCDQIESCFNCEMIHQDYDLRGVCMRYKKDGETSIQEKFLKPNYIPNKKEKNTMEELYRVVVKRIPPEENGDYENEEDFKRYYDLKLREVSKFIQMSTPKDFFIEEVKPISAIKYKEIPIVTDNDLTIIANHITFGNITKMSKILNELFPAERNAFFNMKTDIVASHAIITIAKELETGEDIFRTPTK